MAIDYRIYILSREENVKVFIALVFITGMLSYLFYESIIPMLFVPIFFKRIRLEYARYKCNSRKNQLRLQFKDFLYSLSSSFSTGRHLEEALQESIGKLEDIYGNDSYITNEVKIMISKMNKACETDIEVLSDFSNRSEIEDVENFTEVFRACRETGGNLIGAMNKSATVIGEKITIENEIRTMVSQKKFEGRLITGMPIVIILFLRMMSPEYLHIMYTTIAGRLLMTMSIGATIFAYYLIERITAIEV